MRHSLSFLLSFLLLYSSASALDHPCLYFSAADLPRLKNEAAGVKALQFQRLKAWGDRNIDTAPPPGIGTSESLHENYFSVVTNFGLLYQLTGDRRYIEAGKRWLDILLVTDKGSEGNYHIGIFAASLAHGYDLFYTGLTRQERERLRSKLIEVAGEARYGASHSWWAGLYTHHDFWIPLAGLGIAGVCLRGECSQADTLVSFAAGELSRATGLLGERGYWPEGVADWVYGMAPTLMFFEALARAGGPDLYERNWFKATARARLQHWLPDDSYMYIGDSYRSGRYGTLGSVSAHVLMKLAARYRDGHAQWLALREAAVDSAGPPGLALEAPYAYASWKLLPERQVHGLAWQFLWYDPALKPAPPETLVQDQLYSNWDTAVFRAGWGVDCPVLAFTGGHQLGRAATGAWKAGLDNLPGGLAHTHLNAGSIYLWADGGFPLAPPGYGGRDGRFQNTIMIDGHGQLFEPDRRGNLTAFESGDGWAMATMELAPAYPPDVRIDRFTRTLVFLKPRTVLILDRLTTRDGDKKYIRRYEWLLHTDPAETEWTAGGDSLAARGRKDGRTRLAGRIFPTRRWLFETQSMNRPDGTPTSRALSLTLAGEVPVQVEIAALLHAPKPGAQTAWLADAQCLRDGGATLMIIPAADEEPSRAVLFASADTLYLAPPAGQCDFILAVGLKPGAAYSLDRQSGERDRGILLVQDNQGRLQSDESGCLVLKRPY